MPPRGATPQSRADNCNRGSEKITVVGNRLSDADADAKVDGPLGTCVAVAQRALNVDPGLHRGRYGCEGGHDAIACVFHLASTLRVQRGANDLVVLANEHHKAFVTQFLSLLRRVTQVSEENDSNSRLDVRFSRRVSGKFTEKCVDGPVAHLDDVVGDQTVRLPVYRFQRLSVRSLGETEDHALFVIEPIRDVADLVLVLNGEIELVGGGDVGSLSPGALCRSRNRAMPVRLVSRAISCRGEGA